MDKPTFWNNLQIALLINYCYCGWVSCNWVYGWLSFTVIKV